MKKENYFTFENREEKITEWKNILSNYYSKSKNFKFNFDSAALFVIDMQEYFLNPLSHAYLPAAEAIIEPIKRLQEAFLKKNKPIIFFQYGVPPNAVYASVSMMKRWWKEVLTTDNELFKISPKFDLTNIEVRQKEHYDAFTSSNLAFYLDHLGYNKIVITGVATHLCCESTARSAFEYDFEVYLPIDCLATYNEEIHLNSLKSASHGFGIPISSSDILELEKNEED